MKQTKQLKKLLKARDHCHDMANKYEKQASKLREQANKLFYKADIWEEKHNRYWSRVEELEKEMNDSEN